MSFEVGSLLVIALGVAAWIGARARTRRRIARVAAITARANADLAQGRIFGVSARRAEERRATFAALTVTREKVALVRGGETRAFATSELTLTWIGPARSRRGSSWGVLCRWLGLVAGSERWEITPELVSDLRAEELLDRVLEAAQGAIARPTGAPLIIIDGGARWARWLGGRPGSLGFGGFSHASFVFFANLGALVLFTTAFGIAEDFLPGELRPPEWIGVVLLPAVVIAVAVGVTLAFRRLARVEVYASGVSFTHGPTSVFHRWDELEGYRDRSSEAVEVVLKGSWPGISPAIPTRTDVERTAVLALLDAKGLLRLEPGER